MANILNTSTVGDIIFDKNELIEVTTDMKVEDAAELMKNRDIIAVPVFDQNINAYVGILDIFEVMRFTTVGFFEQDVFKDDHFTEFEYSLESVGDLIKKSQNSRRIHVFESSDPIIMAIRQLSSTKYHALVKIFDEKTFKKSYRLLTRYDLVHFINKHSDKLARILDQRINEIGLVNPLGSTVVSVSTKDKTSDGFLKMFYNNIHAVAVVDELGVLVGNLSSSDLRGLSRENIDNIKLPPLEFLNSMQGLFHPVTCKPESHLNEVINKSISAKVHRIWVTDSGEKPLGVVTFTDILKCFVEDQSQSQ